jgi:hypothetical protein
VVGQGDRRGAVLGCPPAEPVYAAGPIQERILGMNVKMDEVFQVLMCLA